MYTGQNREAPLLVACREDKVDIALCLVQEGNADPYHKYLIKDKPLKKFPPAHCLPDESKIKFVTGITCWKLKPVGLIGFPREVLVVIVDLLWSLEYLNLCGYEFGTVLEPSEEEEEVGQPGEQRCVPQ